MISLEKEIFEYDGGEFTGDATAVFYEVDTEDIENTAEIPAVAVPKAVESTSPIGIDLVGTPHNPVVLVGVNYGPDDGILVGGRGSQGIATARAFLDQIPSTDNNLRRGNQQVAPEVKKKHAGSRKVVAALAIAGAGVIGYQVVPSAVPSVAKIIAAEAFDHTVEALVDVLGVGE